MFNSFIPDGEHIGERTLIIGEREQPFYLTQRKDGNHGNVKYFAEGICSEPIEVVPHPKRPGVYIPLDI